MSQGEGRARNVPISMYPIPHIEIVNEAIKYKGFNGPADFVQYLIEDYEYNHRKKFLRDVLNYILYPFTIIFLIIIYSYAIENWYLYWVSGGLSSLFIYSVYIWTLRIRGIDPKTHWRSKKRRKTKNMENNNI